jgi:hypothetical protein
VPAAELDPVERADPRGRYRDPIEVDGEETIVRESDGIHLNDVGSSVAAEAVLGADRRGLHAQIGGQRLPSRV